MARINTNIPSVLAQRNLRSIQSELQTRFERLSTGLRINRGADDPAGLIISERLRSNISGVNQGISNSDRAANVISTTEASLSEVSDLLNSIKSLIVESANTGANSDAERNANQLQIDSAIASITRISDTASFGSLKLLNGSLDYNLSGVNPNDVVQAKVWNASFISQATYNVDVNVVASAQTGALYFQPPSAAGTILSSSTLQIAGVRGVQTISVTSNASLTSVVAAVNNLTSLTGVRASLINNDPTSGMVFNSVDYGSNSFVAVKRLQGPALAADAFTNNLYKVANNLPAPAGVPFNWSTLISGGTVSVAQRDEGQNVQALVNGSLATGDGLKIKVNSPNLSMDMQLSATFATTVNNTASSFDITGGGSLFQLGPDVSASQQASFATQSMAASNLGGTLVGSTMQFLSSLTTGGTNSIDASLKSKDFTTASDILERAIDDVSILRGRLGAFQRNVLEPNTRSLNSALENLTASSSAIRDADFAAETSALTRAQILSQSGTTVLQLANASSQSVLQLLQG
ncbi:MAG: flagellin [Phycisphaerales bacterium]